MWRPLEKQYLTINAIVLGSIPLRIDYRESFIFTWSIPTFFSPLTMLYTEKLWICTLIELTFSTTAPQGTPRLWRHQIAACWGGGSKAFDLGWLPFLNRLFYPPGLGNAGKIFFNIVYIVIYLYEYLFQDAFQ